jgi:hypothetical protein
MRFSAQEVRRGRAAGQGTAAPPLVLPFDHVATLTLRGEPGRVIEAVINTEVDGEFVAEGIGYGFEPRRGRPVPIPSASTPTSNFSPSRVRLDQLPASALIRGVRIAPELIDESFVGFDPGDPAGSLSRVTWSTGTLQPRYRDMLLESPDSHADVAFMFSMIDTATGRELQDEPTYSVASLGTSTGRRPFRRLAQPLTFRPRSTLRIQVTELTDGADGTLDIVLYGYKLLNLASCPEAMSRSLRALHEVQRGAVPDGRILPFDYVASVDLLGLRRTRHQLELPINHEGAYIATSIGYALQVDDHDVQLPVDPNAPPRAAGAATWDLNVLQLGDLPPNALIDGVRIRPDMVRVAFQDNGALASALPAALVPGLFERLNCAEDVLFRYEIAETGTGRALQNRSVSSIAGLGSADGGRPFRQLARPLALVSGSTLQVDIEERRGRGRLFLVFQGFKVLGAPALPAGQTPMVRRRSAGRR